MQKITVKLGGIVCDLVSAKLDVLVRAQRLFGDRFAPENTKAVDAEIELVLVDKLPVLPQESPATKEKFSGGGMLYAYHLEKDHVALYLTRSNGLVVYFKGLFNSDMPTARVLMKKAILMDGGLEDIVMFTLAPVLRKKSIFLAHAFSTVLEEKAALFVGTSGSGKTTTGLNLLANGWLFLANDVTLLEPRQEKVWALPSPGCFNISPQTLQLLPWLEIPSERFNEVYGKYEVPVAELVADVEKRPFPIHYIFLLERQQSFEHTLIPVSQAVALAQLMEESIDRWDAQTFNAHLSALEQLVRQSVCFHLKLGFDVDGLPAFLAAALAQING
jgi:hypothetical protein